jgi:tetratricopeptide (TPR) repeat protein
MSRPPPARPWARRRHRWCRGLLACLALACGPVAHAQGDEVWACLNVKDGVAQTVAHCTAAIEAKDLADAKRAALFTQRGLARMANRDLERAREDFDAAIHLDDNSAWAHNSRAVLRMQNGNVEQAISDYEQAVRLKPAYAFAWANLGNARLIRGDAGHALADLDEAIRLAPPRIEIALTGRGKAWLAKGDFDRAIEDFDAALKAKPQYANALSGRATARFCKGDFDAAAEDSRSERLLRKDAETAIDLLIALRRGGHDARTELAQISKEFDAAQGLPPAIALFSATLTPEQTLQAAGDRDPNVQRQRLCAAQFQVGEWYLLQSHAAQAREHLTRARETCDQSQPGFAAAGAELARLK